ncbi:gamma-glutamyl-gamma-aminobutyrate hydrolase family protein [Aestuariirhabdus sp. Z084]|uniref:gamma-glutamyl-gamma-aminobutyrate hydrolase family protein n=1 Tax=Aestuariirhabdus haliotis TaxID=2918751 RepID=UPI00201B3FD2|nr:gamma-glutamyl-gamma-aminobutyrate hydrolase family protein [Aestuariirhabdus haliotis]MCL6414197.1 gamma-glutamyl-gamma-aminobutyrate hydrolase family protein [Aestuariirhabdus haliotis]MCL6418129.1 gamma-glutamyl-gamma-aminobutyrate hydrolase family protein [Aestuariirhabdus haliotis]
MSYHSLKPMVGVSACTRQLGIHPFHVAGNKYLVGLVEGSDVLPVIIPALGDALEARPTLERLDGLLLTGSYSMVQPHLYGADSSVDPSDYDLHRDATTLPLIREAIDSGVPVLAICRGFQEMNVAFGGSLHQRLHDTGRYQEHREDKELPIDQQYAVAHRVLIESGGVLASLVGEEPQMVNSLHTQGVDQLGLGLQVEARAEDGLVEAFSVGGAPGFNLAVQWHPEWKVAEHPFYLSIFKAFGDACRQRAHDNNRG